MNTRSVHFPPAPAPEPHTDEQPSPPRPRATQRAGAEHINVMDRFASAVRDVELARTLLRALLRAKDRHGDLQVVLSATRRLEKAVLDLIAYDESL